MAKVFDSTDAIDRYYCGLAENMQPFPKEVEVTPQVINELNIISRQNGIMYYYTPVCKVRLRLPKYVETPLYKALHGI